MSLLIDAGDSAWARGAHEVRCLLLSDFSFGVTRRFR